TRNIRFNFSIQKQKCLRHSFWCDYSSRMWFLFTCYNIHLWISNIKSLKKDELKLVFFYLSKCLCTESNFSFIFLDLSLLSSILIFVQTLSSTLLNGLSCISCTTSNKSFKSPSINVFIGVN